MWSWNIKIKESAMRPPCSTERADENDDISFYPVPRKLIWISELTSIKVGSDAIIHILFLFFVDKFDFLNRTSIEKVRRPWLRRTWLWRTWLRRHLRRSLRAGRSLWAGRPLWTGRPLWISIFLNNSNPFLLWILDHLLITKYGIETNYEIHLKSLAEQNII